MRNTKYWPLTSYLKYCNQDELTLTFEEIEEILGFKLSPCKRNHLANWSNTKTIRLPLSWLDAGYKTHDVDMENEIVHFTIVK